MNGAAGEGQNQRPHGQTNMAGCRNIKKNLISVKVQAKQREDPKTPGEQSWRKRQTRVWQRTNDAIRARQTQRQKALNKTFSCWFCKLNINPRWSASNTNCFHTSFVLIFFLRCWNSAGVEAAPTPSPTASIIFHVLSSLSSGWRFSS